MRYAIVSDIHANRQAWRSVVADAEGLDADAIICLGDVVGYGPMPQAVLDSVRERAAAVVLGNHDAAVCGRLDPSIFNDHARAVVEWTRQHIDADGIQFLNKIPYAIEADDALFVHAETIEPARFEYIQEPAQAAEHLAACRHRIVFIGHTHHPAVFVLHNNVAHEYPADDFELAKGQRYIVNVGSVGEPRDPDDFRARYAIYDTESNMVHFRGVHFDVDGYRADLQREGLNIQPYFLQVLARESGEKLAPIIPETRAMTRSPVVPSGSHALKPRRLVVTPGPATGSRPTFTAPIPDRKAVNRLATQPKEKTNKSNLFLALISFLIFAALIPTWYFALKSPDESSEPDEWARRFTEARERRASLPAPAAPLAAAKPQPAKSKPAAASTTTPASEKPSSMLGSGLLSYWTADSTFNVSSGNAKPKPQVIGNAGKAPGKFGKGFIILPNTGITYGDEKTYAVGSPGLSASFWFQANRPDDNDRLLIGTRTSGESDASGWCLYASNNELGALVSASKNTKRSPPAQLPDDNPEWTHVILIIDPAMGVLQLYRNGALASETDISNLGKNIPSAGPLSIGIDPDIDNARNYHGTIDDLAIWNRLLNSGEIQQIFTGGSAPKEPLEKLLGQ